MILRIIDVDDEASHQPEKCVDCFDKHAQPSHFQAIIMSEDCAVDAKVGLSPDRTWYECLTQEP